MSNGYEYMHRRLGCADCRFANPSQLGKGPCCTYAFKLDISDDGRCLTREPKEEKEEKGS